MSTRTGFLVGIGTVTAALTIGFTGGYVLTNTNDVNKTRPMTISKRGDSASLVEANPHVLKSQTASVAEEKPFPPPVFLTPVDAATAALSAPLSEQPPVSPQPPPAVPPLSSAVPVVSVAKEVNPVEALVKAPRPAPKVRTKNVAQERPKMDVVEIKRAIEADIQRRRGGGGIEAAYSQEPRERGLANAGQ